MNAIVGIGFSDEPDRPAAARREQAAQVRVQAFRAWLEEMSASESAPAQGWLLTDLATTSTEMFALELEGWADAGTLGESLGGITAPTLIVTGEQEDEDGGAHLVAERLADATVVLLPGFGHLQAFYRTDVSGPVIRAFLDRHVPVPGG